MKLFARAGHALTMAAVLQLGVLVLPTTQALAQPFVYVLGQTDTAPGSTNAGPQYVTVIDTATRTKVARITAGVGCICIGAEGLALSRDGALLYVANEIENSLTVIATATNSVVTTIPAVISGGPDRGPIGIEVSPDNARLFVLSNSGAVEVFNRASLTRITTVPLGVIQSRGLAVTPDGARLYVSTYGSNSVKVVDLATYAVTATVALPANSLPITVEVTPDGSHVYVAAPFTNSVAVLDAQTNTLLPSVSVGTRPYSLAIAPGGGFVYAANRDSQTLSRIDTATRTVTATVSAVAGATAIDFMADGSHAWTAGVAGVFQVATSTNAVVGTPLAWDAATDGVPAALVTTPPPFTAPPNPPPTNVTATVSGNAVSMTWTAPAGSVPLEYVLEGGLAPGQVLASIPTNSTATTFAFAAPTGVFFVRLHALTPAGRSPASNEVQIFVNVPRVPAAPTNLLGLVDGFTVALAWHNGSGGGLPSSLLLDVSGAISATLPLGLTDTFSFDGVPPGTYTFSVRAGNQAGVSASSAPVTLTFPSTCSGPPNVPARLVAGWGDRLLSVGWDLPTTGPAPTSYVLRARGAVNVDLPLTRRLISAPGVPPGTYDLSVVAVNACGQSPSTPVRTAVVTP